MMLDRLELLVKDKIKDIKNKHVLVIGLGGVGGYTVESLIRSGIEKITIVDYDKIDITNLNRQIIANMNNIGCFKVDEMEKRIISINPNCKIYKIKDKITIENIDILFQNKIDYLIDACDTVSVKKELILKCIDKKIKFISCMGTGNKMDPSKLKIMDVRDTNYDPLARIIRKMVKDKKIKDKIYVVASSEIPIKRDKIGSNAYVPSTAGLLLTSYVINDIVGEL
ncbi:MAG: ThiF family adenylyltransferase [Bacilli bacterium]|nr:ThiF family adenylyltransferase [Bacilli bacterium]